MQCPASRPVRANDNALKCGTAGHCVRFVSLLVLTLLAGSLVYGSESLQSSVLETTIVGLEVRGRTAFEVTVLKDFDVLWVGDSVRYLPVRRLLEALKMPYEELRDSLRFQNAVGEMTVIVTADSTITIAGERRRLDMKFGVSDVSRAFDIYLHESEFTHLFNLSLTWDEANYAIGGRTTSRFPAWQRKASSRRPALLANANDFASDLPERLPPSRPALFGDPSIHFLQPGVRYTQREADRFSLFNSLGAWGRILGGRYALKLVQYSPTDRMRVALEQMRVTHRFGDVESALGDINIGLSDLVLPRNTFAGASVNGLLGLSAKERDADRSDFGRREVYQSRRDFIGTARMGSTVELYVDNRFVAEQLVTQQQWAGPDEGVYEFLDIDLVRDRINRARIVITQPDGSVIEHHEEVVGTGALLRPGQLSLAAAVGQRRFTELAFWKTQGAFGGAHLLYGLTPQWSFGGSAGYQDLYSLPYDLERARVATIALQDTIPTTSEHYSLQTRFQCFRRINLATEVAASRSEFDPRRAGILTTSDTGPVGGSSTEFAGHTTIDMHLGSRMRFLPDLFYFGPHYFDGTTARLRNRQGIAIDARFRIGQATWLTASYGEVENNVDRRSSSTLRQRWAEARVPVPRLIPRTNIRLAGTRFENLSAGSGPLSANESGARHAARADVHSTLLRVCEIESNVVIGQELLRRNEENLMADLSVVRTPAFLQPQWTVRASRKLMKEGRISLGQVSSPVQRLTQLAHVLRASESNHWQWRMEGGYDWVAQDWFMLVQPGYYFDRTGTSQVSLLARYARETWFLSLTIRLEPVLSLVGGRPFLVSSSQINPSGGGVKGIVFLDSNGNGKREEDEPGMPGIDVIGGDTRRATSGNHGEFLLPAGQQRRRMKVSLDSRTLPAMYTATNGTQWANVESGLLTPVELGITELGSISGYVLAPDSRDSTRSIGVPALRIIAKDRDGRIRQESVTDSDGSYFLGDLAPGAYTIAIDRATIGKSYSPWPEKDSAEVRIGKPNSLDLHDVNLRLKFNWARQRQRMAGSN